MKQRSIPAYDCGLCRTENKHLMVPKPKHFTPSVKKTVCEGCESTLVLRVSVPRGRKSMLEVKIELVSFAPSQKLMDMLKTKEEKPALFETSEPSASPLPVVLPCLDECSPYPPEDCLPAALIQESESR